MCYPCANDCPASLAEVRKGAKSSVNDVPWSQSTSSIQEKNAEQFQTARLFSTLAPCRVHGAESLHAELCLARRVLSCRSFAPKAQGRAPACLPCLRRTPGAGDVCSRHEGLPRTGGASALTGSGVLLGVVWLSAACIAEEERFRRAGSCVADGRRRGHARRRRDSPGSSPHGFAPAVPALALRAPSCLSFACRQPGSRRHGLCASSVAPPEGGDGVQKERLPEPNTVREPLLEFASMMSSSSGFA